METKAIGKDGNSVKTKRKPTKDWYADYKQVKRDKAKDFRTKPVRISPFQRDLDAVSSIRNAFRTRLEARKIFCSYFLGLSSSASEASVIRIRVEAIHVTVRASKYVESLGPAIDRNIANPTANDFVRCM